MAKLTASAKMPEEKQDLASNSGIGESSMAWRKRKKEISKNNESKSASKA